MDTRRALAETLVLGIANGLLLGIGLTAANVAYGLLLACGLGTLLSFSYLLAFHRKRWN